MYITDKSQITDKEHTRQRWEERKKYWNKEEDIIDAVCPYCGSFTNINKNGCKCCTFCGKKLNV